MKNKVSVFCYICILFVAVMTGCSSPEDVESRGTALKGTSADWEQGFQQGPLGEGGQMYTVDYRELDHEHPEDNTNPRLRVIKAVGDAYVDFYRYYLDERTVYYLEQISMDGADKTYMNIHPKDWGIEDNEIWGFDALGERYYFGVGIYEEEEPEWNAEPVQCYVVVTDGEGRLQSQVDILSGLKELGFGGILEALYVDGEGYIYVVGNDERRDSLYILDKQGQSVASYTCPLPERDMLFSPVRDDSGRIFFPVKETGEGATRLLWKDGRNEIAELGRMDNATISTWYTMRGSELYYAEGGAVVRWNVTTGKRERIFNLKENGISDYLGTMLFWDNAGNAYLRYKSKNEDWVSRLSFEEPQLGDPVRVGILTQWSGAEFVQSSLATFCRTNPLYPVEVEKVSGTDNADNAKERILIDVMNGKGPDVLYLSYEDLLRLKNWGALAEMGGLIPDSVRERLLPGVVEYGEIDGGMYGIPSSVVINTMFTNRELWNSEGWTLDEVLELAEENKDIYGIFTYGDSNVYGYETLSLLTEYDLAQGKSKFIDWEKKISCFEEQDFMRVLEVIGSYEENRNEVYEMYGIENKAALALPWNSLSAEDFFYLMGVFGEIGYAVGVPAEDGRGNYLMAEGLLAVREGVSEEKLEIIQEMFSYLLSPRCQFGLHGGISVIEDMVDYNVQYSEAEDQYYWMDGTDDWRYLKKKEDGSTYIEDFKELLRSAVPYKDYCPIYDIVQEEAGAFFEGQSDALTVTRLIDNRVQLYLDENK